MKLEEKEKQLHQQIAEQVEKQNKEIKDKKDMKGYLSDLDEEKKLVEDLKNLEFQINNARMVGNFGLANQLVLQRNKLFLDNAELANRDAIKLKIDAENLALQDKRDLADAELRILELIVAGRQNEADKLRAVLLLQRANKRY